jgi:hypothetical protein
MVSFNKIRTIRIDDLMKADDFWVYCPNALI